MKVIVSAGGTGGHIYPALAIIDILKKYDKDLEVLYVGTHNRMEKDIVPQKGIRFESLEIYGFNKKRVLKNIKNVFLINKAFKKSKKLMKEFKPDLVVGAGGYVTYPVLKTAQKLGIKTLLHEQNSFPGKTNIALSKKADLIGVSMEKSKEKFKNTKGKVFLMGNPCALSAINAPKITKKELGLDSKLPLVTVVCGSLGSMTVNNAFKEVLKNVKDKNYQVIYITGKAYYEEFIKDKYSSNVHIKPYLDNLRSVLKVTDVLVSRAGASTMSEVMALKVPTIFIPSPYVANNHQYYNALDLVDKKAALMLEEKYFSAKALFEKIDELIKSNEEVKKNLDKIKNVDSEEVLLKEVRKLFNDR